jgi:hypothetical protein
MFWRPGVASAAPQRDRHALHARGERLAGYFKTALCRRQSLISRINRFPHHRFDGGGEVVLRQITCKPFACSLPKTAVHVARKLGCTRKIFGAFTSSQQR